MKCAVPVLTTVPVETYTTYVVRHDDSITHCAVAESPTAEACSLAHRSTVATAMESEVLSVCAASLFHGGPIVSSAATQSAVE